MQGSQRKDPQSYEGGRGETEGDEGTQKLLSLMRRE